MVQRHSYHFFFLLAVLGSSVPQRRIKDGFEVFSPKPYAVYFLGDTSSPNNYHGWTCGGAIISPDYILTAAACVQDVQHVFAIAGYKKYVAADRMDEDPCIKEKKKKVILICVPREYRLDYNRTETWAKIDIAVVKVESPFNFNDKSFEKVCHYTPQAIDYNLERDFPKENEDAIVLGWGHSKEFRKDTELQDMNHETLYYAPVRIITTEQCSKYFVGNDRLLSFLKASMICTLGTGNLNENGGLLARMLPPIAGCIDSAARSRGAVGPMCDEERAEVIYGGGADTGDLYGDDDEILILSEDRKSKRNSRKQNNDGNKTQNEHRRNDDKIEGADKSIFPNIGEEFASLRTKSKEEEEEEEIVTDSVSGVVDYGAKAELEGPGICQNDHGGPLVAWRGGKEVLVAVATLFKLNRKYRCGGPYLFTKTWCNGAFIKCIVDQKPPDNLANHNLRRSRCDHPEETGFEIMRRHISWVGHRDGPAENEKIQLRHQVPISAFHSKYPRKTSTNISVAIVSNKTEE